MTTTATALCPCLHATPLSLFAGVPCLEIALSGSDPITACLIKEEDFETFGVGCGPHWESTNIALESGGSVVENEDWYHREWCFVDPQQCDNTTTLDVKAYETTTGSLIRSSLALSYATCSNNAQQHQTNTPNQLLLRGRKSAPEKIHVGDLGWEFVGPTGYVPQFGKEDQPKLVSAGAVQNVVESTPGTWFLGSVNGGIWRTDTLHHDRPHWTNVLDGQENVTCSSISALFANGPTVYAGCGGSTSSEQGSDWNVVNSGDWGGLMVSKDGRGDHWTMVEGFPVNYYITDILELDDDTLLVAAQSHLWNRDDGGIWWSTNGGEDFAKVDDRPTFTLTRLGGNVLATHARSRVHSVSVSRNQGQSFESVGPLPWDEGAIPFYTCATVLGDGRVVVAGLTRLGPNNQTDSQIFVGGSSSDLSTTIWTQIQQPTRMDEDGMPKDRMALLADPEVPDLLYVAGNAGALAWRVQVGASSTTTSTTTTIWTKLWDEDVVDGSLPHGDCRNYAWDAKGGGRLLLVSDGGVFARQQPRQTGGRWVSLNGDYSSLELLSAHYDWKNDRYVAGAQDNCAMVTQAGARPGDEAFGFVEGDGAITLVDSNASPSRLFGTTQFLGVGTIENDPNRMRGDDDDDDDGCGGLCFAQGDKFIEIEVDKYFPEPSSFPFFVHPYTLNRQDPTLLHLWTNGTAERPSAFYQFSIPYSVQDKDDIGAPTKLFESPEGAMILDFVSGGYTAGKADPDLILAISNTHLYVHSSSGGEEPRDKGSSMMERPLPVTFAMPVTLDYDDDNQGARILGPLTHARTVSLAVASSDSSVIAVTGWQSIETNVGDEAIFVTTDTGKTWRNITGDLKTASGVVGKVRPGGLLWVDLDDNSQERALLVGTSNGILIAFVVSNTTSQAAEPQQWRQLGTHKEFPIVLTADIDYEPHSDRLVAATFGRGIYVLKDAKEKLLELRNSMSKHNLKVSSE